MLQKKRIQAVEFTVIALLWCITIILPLLFIDQGKHSWPAVHIMWSECAIVAIVFCINRFLLMPQLFFKKLYNRYFVWLLILFAALSIFIFWYKGVSLIHSLFVEPINTPPFDTPPHLEMPPPPSTHPKSSALPPAIGLFIVAIFVVALDAALSIASRWLVDQQQQSDVERQRVMAQLSNLQSQVSPHFLMNTLNNIHALVDIDASRAKQTIIELSGLMDYLLYESSNQERVPLTREIDFITSYINLMRLRFPEEVLIDFTHEGNISNIKIPPLLLLNFIENAFKYGVDYERLSFINISIKALEDRIEMSVSNSNHAKLSTSKRRGLGISNTRKRLDILYGNHHSLSIVNKDNIYYVTLNIPIVI